MPRQALPARIREHPGLIAATHDPLQILGIESVADIIPAEAAGHVLDHLPRQRRGRLAQLLQQGRRDERLVMQGP